MRAIDLGPAGVASTALVLALAATGALGCSWGHATCDPESYSPSGLRVEAVEECPPFPASCPLDCDASPSCAGDGLSCEDCDALQAWLDRNAGTEGEPCVLLPGDLVGPAMVLGCTYASH